MRNNLPTLTPELRAEMQEKARIVREEKKEKAKGYKQDYMSKNHWAELCSKYEMKMPPYYAHCSETKYLPSEISSNLSSLFLQSVCIEPQSCQHSSTLDSSCSLGPLEKGGEEATEEMTRNPRAASFYFGFRLPGASHPH